MRIRVGKQGQTASCFAIPMGGAVLPGSSPCSVITAAAWEGVLGRD